MSARPEIPPDWDILAGAEPLSSSARHAVVRLHLGGRTLIRKQTFGADARERWAAERALLASLTGVAGVPQLAAGPQPSTVLLLEDAGGTPLAQLLRAGPLTMPALLAIAMPLLQTLAELHRRRIVHHQLCAANVLLAEPRPLWTGFSRAGAEEQAIGAAGLEAAPWLAPEQTGRTGRRADQRADLYAFGALLYEALCGRPPFDAGDPLQLVHDVLALVPRPPAELAPSLPQALSDIVMRLLDKEPERRYQSADGLLHDLQRLSVGQPVVVGERDFAARLVAPPRPVGRNAELALLRRAFDDSRHGCRGVLVAGAPGVGKTTLINELRPQVVAQRGWFVSGKFDQYRQDRSTDAVHQAFRALGRLLLAEPEAELAPLRARLLDGLGSNAGLVAWSNPEFALLLGVAPEPPGDDPAIAGRRQVRAAVDLICAITSVTRPLVVVLDDLQWAAPSPLAWVDAMLADARAQGLLLVCAYRASEIDAAHPLTAMQARWHQQPAAPLRLVLNNLGPAELAALLGEMLRLPVPEASAFAEALAPHCGGNPFDTVELVNALRDEGALTQRASAGSWHWDPAAIRRHVGRSEVIDLLRTRLRRLPLHSQRLLGLMACLGGVVQPALLQTAAGLSPDALDERLAPALDDGLLLADTGGDGAVRFRHDRVQQAAYACLTPASRRRLHLVLARRLAASTAFADFAAEQYLPAVGALRDSGERRLAAQRFRGTASGLRTLNLPLTERLLAAALSLLDNRSDPLHAAVQIEHHAALYALGRLDEADIAYQAIEAGSADLLQRVDPACVQISALSNRGRLQEATALGLGLLGELGFQAPAAVSSDDLLRCHEAMAAHAHDDLQRAPASAPAVLSAGKLMNRLMPALHRRDLAGMRWLVSEAMQLWALHGPCAELVGPIAHVCHVSGTTAADYRRGYETLRHVLAVGEARGFEPAASQARFLFGLGAGHWFEPLEDSLASLPRAREGLLHGGDLQNACFTYMPLMSALIDCAPTLDRFSAEVEAALAFSERTGNRIANTTFTGLRHLIAVLAGEPGAPTALAQWFAAVSAGDAIQDARRHALCALAAALCGDGTALPAHTGQESADRHPHHFYAFTQVKLLRGLALADQLRSTPGNLARLAEFDVCRDWMAERAADAPANFGHLLAWLEAERAWATGEPWAATCAFEAALREVALRQRPWHAALIAERAARFHFAHGLEHAGRALIAEARRRFAAWGAGGAVRRLDAEYAWLRAAADEPLRAASLGAGAAAVSRGAAASADAIDMLAIVRASQALASETSLPRLHASVVALLGDMTGATAVRVLLWSDAQWHDPAAGGALPLSVLRYVERTRESLVVDDAARDDRFAADPQLRGACSLLAEPIVHQGELRALLLLENRLSRAAFGAGRLDAVRLITGQLAVSLANVQLYDSLEQRVQQRTRELEQAQARFVAAARQAGMAEIATNVLHNVGNVLNSVNVSANLVSTQLRGSQAKGLQRAVQLIDEQGAGLAEFLTQDVRGRLLPSYLRELASALQAEQQAMGQELNGLCSSIDHIKAIVATQQCYAGTARLLESVQVGELIEDALRMNADALLRHRVAVAKNIAELPALPLDRHRVVQILVNLISNAKQALNGVADARITIEAGLMADGRSVTGLVADGRPVAGLVAGTRLRLRVIDNGEGIAADRLVRVFSHGFTTRRNGYGFGLHTCVLAAQEMGGTLQADSDGHGSGATFTLELPIDQRRAPEGAVALKR
ncbi:trifunctional serine/threonine-protein kinase/ATP-binding protein/sensor histidine kinase [Aquabacterium sp.]|uniref:trifunctional serine/threonine-protein kinase/ATP-binding protein/sensor histidine kinase n=1 Tax=Aquabacterium sp. TaxID=1872578 RepID=UPI002CBB729B|nr:AAA family ATPase [Aquabacterium sp.]HSW06682.1 AAA family ATPase [Aquabacterium sp.]